MSEGVGGIFNRPWNLPPPCEKCQRDKETCPDHGPGAAGRRKVARIMGLIEDLEPDEKALLWIELEESGLCLRCKSEHCGGWCDYDSYA